MSDKLQFTINQAGICKALEYYYNNVVYRPESKIKIIEVSKANSYDEHFTVYIAEPNPATIEKGGE